MTAEKQIIENTDKDSTLSDFCLPKYNEIPAVGLFLEQVSKYINDCLNMLEEPELTGSMISNYVKKSIITNPVKKTYGRDQIASLIFIAIAKNVLSLEDIKCMLDLQKESCSTEDAYRYFADRFEHTLANVCGSQKTGNSIRPDADDNPGVEELKRLTENVCITTACKIHLDMTFKGLRTDRDSEKTL